MGLMRIETNRLSKAGTKDVTKVMALLCYYRYKGPDDPSFLQHLIPVQKKNPFDVYRTFTMLVQSGYFC